jgi:hypothetical protein
LCSSAAWHLLLVVRNRCLILTLLAPTTHSMLCVVGADQCGDKVRTFNWLLQVIQWNFTKYLCHTGVQYTDFSNNICRMINVHSNHVYIDIHLADSCGCVILLNSSTAWHPLPSPDAIWLMPPPCAHQRWPPACMLSGVCLFLSCLSGGVQRFSRCCGLREKEREEEGERGRESGKGKWRRDSRGERGWEGEGGGYVVGGDWWADKVSGWWGD